MASIVPPAKRQKVYHGIPEPPQEPPKPSPSIVVQFVNEHDATPIAPAVSLPANVARESLETLVNQLRTKDDDEHVPYTFHVALPEHAAKPESPTRIVISRSIEADVFGHPSHAFSEEDILVIKCAPQSVFKVRPATRCSSTLSGHSSPILCASFSPTGALLATGSGDTHVRLWDLNTETPSHTLAGHSGWVLCVEWDPMERKLASGGHDGHVRLWDPKLGKPIGEAMRGHSKWVTSLAWEPVHLNPSAPRLASSSKDGTVRVWATLTRRLEYALGGHTASVNVVKWGGGGKGGRGVLYTASSDRTVRIWDPQGGKQLIVLKDHAHWVTTLALNTDFVLRTGPFDHTSKKPASDEQAQALALKRYEALVSRSAGSGNLGKFVATLRGHVGPVYRLAWSADSRMVVSASKDATVKIWDLKSYKLKVDLPGHTDEVYCVDFVADKIVSGGRDRTVKIWKN
ncbi:hypothetical protein ID866_7575 [Astraeus odoratus]|nr:hypothetical protein ID866_7575 [Astraeus odoratus]